MYKIGRDTTGESCPDCSLTYAGRELITTEITTAEHDAHVSQGAKKIAREDSNIEID